MTAKLQSKYRAIHHPHIADGWTIQRPGEKPLDLIFASKTGAEVNAAARNKKELSSD